MRASAASGNRFTREKYSRRGEGDVSALRNRANETFRVEETYLFFLSFSSSFFYWYLRKFFFVFRSVLYSWNACVWNVENWDYRRKNWDCIVDWKNDEECEFLKETRKEVLFVIAIECPNFCYDHPNIRWAHTHTHIYI